VEDGQEEPLVTFDFDMRPMRFYFPFHPEKGVIISHFEGKFHWEKNWCVVDSDRKSIYIARTWDPWTVIECDYKAKCRVVNGGGGVGMFRGGAPPVKIPGHPGYSVAWPRTHIPCECGADFYRPHLAIVRGTGANATLIGIGSSFNFSAVLPTWYPDGPPMCEMNHNVLAPMSIARWRVIGGMDEMEVTLSLQDRMVVRVRVRGLLNQLDGLLNAPPTSDREYSLMYQEARKFCLDYTLQFSGSWNETMLKRRNLPVGTL
jgi:hypothetical protein